MSLNIPRFNTVSQQLLILTELLTHVNVGFELKIHLANILDGYVARNSCAFTQDTISVPGMDRRLLDLFVLALRQYGIKVELPKLPVRQSDSIASHRAGNPRVVGVNLIAHRRLDEEHVVNLDALIAREDSYLSAVSTLWMIVLNPEYAQWLVQQTEYKHILLPGLTNRHIWDGHDDEHLILSVGLKPGAMVLQWLATDPVPLGSISPIVTSDPESKHLRTGQVCDDSLVEEE